MNNVVVTVMMGGISSEREVSLHSGAMVAEALRSAGYHVHTLDPDPVRGWTLPKGTDVVFLALHGTYGEDGQVQTALDKIGIPYTGCGAEDTYCIDIGSKLRCIEADLYVTLCCKVIYLCWLYFAYELNK